MAPEDRAPRGPYDNATAANTAPGWMNDSRTGAPIMGEGVEAKLGDLTGYSGNMDQVQSNLSGLSRSVMSPVHGLIQDAFASGADNGFVWTTYMNRLASHNAGKLEEFFGNIGMGIRNVAMAAQAVANAYSNVDETHAANLGAIEFAFGDMSKAPASIPKAYLDQMQTWDEFRAANPAAATVVPQNGIAAEDVTSVTNGNTTTTTVRLPDGGTMVTVTENWANYGARGQTQTVSINGQVQTVTTTTTIGSRTTTTETQAVYDRRGNRRDQVTSETEETVTIGNTNSVRTDERTTTYSYDSQGKRIDESTTSRSVTVGAERPREGMIDFDDDPAQRELKKLMPEPEEEPTILAPGPLGQNPGAMPGPQVA